MSCKRCVADNILELVPTVPKPGNKFTRTVKRFIERGRFIQDYYNAALRRSNLEYPRLDNGAPDRNQFRFSYRHIPKSEEEEYAYYSSHYINSRTNMFSNNKYHNVRHVGEGKLSVVPQNI